MKLKTIVACLLLGLTSCGPTNGNSQPTHTITPGTIQKSLDTMDLDDWPTFEKAHPKAKVLMNDSFFFSPIKETAPFGSDDGADAYAGFSQWRTNHRIESPLVYLQELIIEWKYPQFDLQETDIEKLKPYLKQSDLGIQFMTGVDAAIVAIAFGQLYLEGTIDKDVLKLAKTSIKRELLPRILATWKEYKDERETNLKKLLHALDQVN
jgi:uncharacterized protein YfeS